MLSADALTIEEGSLYPVLQRMLVKGWVLAEWKISANNRRARFYTLTTAGAKKGGAAVGPTRRGKGSKTMAICDRHGLPVAVHVASASPYEPHLVPATLDARFLTDLPTPLIGDRGYASDALHERLMTHYSIEMIAAHRRGRRSTQDGRPLRRARRRWKIERLFAWLHNSPRLVTRWERHVDNFLGLLHLACARTLLRHL